MNTEHGITHSQLVALAAEWLSKKHSIVVTEIATQGEEPDALGWRGASSTLVECKASRSDFLADRDKLFRRESAFGVGQHRYFLSLPGIIRIDELPARWGLLEVTGGRIKILVQSMFFEEHGSQQEIRILLSVLRRMGHSAPEGVSIKCYTIKTKNRATLGVSDSDTEAQDTDAV